ncbi:MAG: hypothetical protein GY694_22335, partial [Gammaproteobacteria bacterium]|nr:hypothetical protein [Gammaproteobacteria bacterium]
MAELNEDNLGEAGVDLVQENIIGAHMFEPTYGARTQITKITFDSQSTKAKIRKAAEKAKRWGNSGTNEVFLRDITLDKRTRQTSKPEDPKTPKKGKTMETPKRGCDSKRRRLAPAISPAKSPPPFGAESRREERVRTVAQRQREQDAHARELLEVKRDQLRARMEKRLHQQREEEATAAASK